MDKEPCPFVGLREHLDSVLVGNVLVNDAVVGRQLGDGRDRCLGDAYVIYDVSDVIFIGLHVVLRLVDDLVEGCLEVDHDDHKVVLDRTGGDEELPHNHTVEVRAVVAPAAHLGGEHHIGEE
eukprot:7270564-Pyramimonas_sp.AAC.1